MPTLLSFAWNTIIEALPRVASHHRRRLTYVRRVHRCSRWSPISNPAASKHSEPGSGTAAIVSRVTNMRSPPPNRPMTDKSVGERIHGVLVRLLATIYHL